MAQQDVYTWHQLREEGVPDVCHRRHVGEIACDQRTLSDDRIEWFGKGRTREIAQVFLDKDRGKVGIVKRIERNNLTWTTL